MRQAVITGLFGLVGVLAGVGIAFFSAKSLIIEEDLRVRASQAYSDYVAEVVNKGIDEKFVGLAEAKARVAVYGDAEVAKKLAHFTVKFSETVTEDGRNAFLDIVNAMRKDLYDDSSHDVETKYIRQIIAGN